MEINRKEIFRYLGYGGHEADETVRNLAEECVRELEQAANCRSLMREYPLITAEDGTIDGGCFRTKSKHLLKNLGGCGRVLVMAATLGSSVDRLLNRYGKLSVTKAVILQAAAAAMIEAYCNELCAGWKEEYEKRGLYLRPRFSPGYGDFSLSCQKELLDGLEAGKRIGITLTEGGLMLPTKTVTAVIGISEKEEPCRPAGCEVCEKRECPYRRAESGAGGQKKQR